MSYHMAPRTPPIQILPELVEVLFDALGFPSDFPIGGVVHEAADVVRVGAALGIGPEEDTLDGAVD